MTDKHDGGDGSELTEAASGYAAEPRWLHLNTAPKDGGIFLAHSRSWKRPQFVRRVTGGEFLSVVTRRKVIPEVWFNLPRYK